MKFHMVLVRPGIVILLTPRVQLSGLGDVEHWLSSLSPAVLIDLGCTGGEKHLRGPKFSTPSASLVNEAQCEQKRERERKRERGWVEVRRREKKNDGHERKDEHLHKQGSHDNILGVKKDGLIAKNLAYQIVSRFEWNFSEEIL